MLEYISFVPPKQDIELYFKSRENGIMLGFNTTKFRFLLRKKNIPMPKMAKGLSYSYQVELKLRKDFLGFSNVLESKVKLEALGDYEAIKNKNKMTFIFTRKGRFLIRPKMLISIQIKKSDHKSFDISLRGKPLSYAYQKPRVYINKLLVKIL